VFLRQVKIHEQQKDMVVLLSITAGVGICKQSNKLQLMSYFRKSNETNNIQVVAERKNTTI
jgi:hypothetical protein